MEIIRAPKSGFCFGVKRAVGEAEKLIEDAKSGKIPGNIYTYGQLVHNRDVTDRLKEGGLSSVESLEDVKPEDTVLIRAHGVPKAFYEEATAKGVTLLDATCPFVAKIHEHVAKAYSEGKNCVIVGDPSHPEVIGINGWCGNTATILNSAEEAEKTEKDNLYVVAQTTIKEEHFNHIVEILQRKFVNVTVANTICSATKERQISTEDTAKSVDAMVVIGGKNSSNNKKLFEIAKK